MAEFMGLLAELAGAGFILALFCGGWQILKDPTDDNEVIGLALMLVTGTLLIGLVLSLF